MCILKILGLLGFILIMAYIIITGWVTDKRYYEQGTRCSGKFDP